MQLNKNDTVVFIGDSITDCDRARPVGEGRFDALGKGYVALADAMIQMHHPELNIRVINMGISGNTVRDVKNRWQSDVLDLAPDWVSLMIGVNDVWRQYDSPRQTEKHVNLDEYRETLSALVDRTKDRVKGVLLLSPFYLEPNRRDAMRHTVDQYGQAMRKVAEHHDAVFVDVQAAFDKLWAHKYPAELSWDRVHPNLTGHMVIATAALAALYDKNT